MPRHTRRKQSSVVNSRYAPILIATCSEPPEPIRGVRLKVVSAFTMVFAILCTLAFIAGYTTR